MPPDHHSLAMLALAVVLPAGYLLSRWLWKKSKLFRVILTGPLMLPAVPFGKLEAAWNRFQLLKQYPGAKVLGGGHSNVVLLAKESEERRVVVKQYGIAGSWLAWMGRIMYPAPSPGGFHRAKRFKSEREAFSDFEMAGIPAARLVRSDAKRLINVSGFIEGRALTDLLGINENAVRESGRSLRLAHDRGWAIIDNQPSNFVVGADGRAYFIDLEHAYRDPRGEYRAWDIGSYLCWLHAGLEEEQAQRAEQAFWAGYGAADAALGLAVAQTRQELRDLQPFMRASFEESKASEGQW